MRLDIITKRVLQLIAGIIILSGAILMSANIGENVQTLFFNQSGGEQVSAKDIFVEKSSLADTSDYFEYVLSEDGVSGGKLVFTTEYTAEPQIDDEWNALVSINGGSQTDAPTYQIVVLEKVVAGQDGGMEMLYGLSIFDPLMDPTEKGIIWTAGGPNIEEETISYTEKVTFDIEWGIAPGTSSTNATLRISDPETDTALGVVGTDYRTANFIGKRVVLRFGAVANCLTPFSGVGPMTFSDGYVLATIVTENLNTSYTCDTNPSGIPLQVVTVPGTDLPGTGVVVSDNPNLLPVDITNVVPDATSATIQFEASVLEEEISATVDPEGNGDFVRIEDALASVTHGTIALAGGVYYIDSLSIPDGVILSGGWDNIGFRTQDFVNNPSYLFQQSYSPVAIVLAGKESGLEGIVITSENTCVLAAGRAHKITNNAFRKCRTAINAQGVAYVHVVNNTFYDFGVGIEFNDYSAGKIVNNIFKTGQTALLNNTTSL